MYEIGDILLLKPQYGKNKQVIVIGLNLNRPKNRYRIRINSNRASASYVASDDIIDRKVGHVESDHPFLVEANKVEKVVTQDELWARDKYVRSLKAGDIIVIERSGNIEGHIFGRYLSSGRAYKFTATNANGTTYKWKLENVQMET